MRALRAEPYHFQTARSAEDANRVLAEQPVNLIICDWRMPGMSGTEFLARVARDYPHIRRIMLTGNATLEMVIGAINNGGICKFLTKPVETDALKSIIREALEDRTECLVPG
jgi:DNA-binding NtrC family response regulator